MANKNASKILVLVGLTVLTLVLGVVAVVTVLKLKESQTASITPNVPQSQPQALSMEFNCTMDDFNSHPACMDSGGKTWGGSEPWRMLNKCPYGDTNNSGGCAEGDTGHTKVFGNCFDEIPQLIAALDPEMCYQMDAAVSTTDQSWCNINPSVCISYQDNLDTCTPKQDLQQACTKSFTIPLRTCAQSCAVNADCGLVEGRQLECLGGTCKNPSCTTSNTCVCGPTVTPSLTPTVTPSVTPGKTPTVTPSTTPTVTPSTTPSPTGTPAPTNTPAPTLTPIPPGKCRRSCGSSDDCVAGLVCSNGMCLNQACLTETDCVCPTSAPNPTNTPGPSSHGTNVVEPTPPALPSAGVTIPSLGLLGIGGLLLIIGMAVALVW